MVSVIFSLNNHTWSTNEKQKEKRNKSKKKKKTSKKRNVNLSRDQFTKEGNRSHLPFDSGLDKSFHNHL